MALTRNVDGKVVEMNAEEEAETRVAWAADDARRAAEASRPKPATMEDRLAALETEVAALKAVRAPIR